MKTTPKTTAILLVILFLIPKLYTQAEFTKCSEPLDGYVQEFGCVSREYFLWGETYLYWESNNALGVTHNYANNRCHKIVNMMRKKGYNAACTDSSGVETNLTLSGDGRLFIRMKNFGECNHLLKIESIQIWNDFLGRDMILCSHPSKKDSLSQIPTREAQVLHSAVYLGSYDITALDLWVKGYEPPIIVSQATFPDTTETAVRFTSTTVTTLTSHTSSTTNSATISTTSSLSSSLSSSSSLSPSFTLFPTATNTATRTSQSFTNKKTSPTKTIAATSTKATFETTTNPTVITRIRTSSPHSSSTYENPTPSSFLSSKASLSTSTTLSSTSTLTSNTSSQTSTVTTQTISTIHKAKIITAKNNDSVEESNGGSKHHEKVIIIFSSAVAVGLLVFVFVIVIFARTLKKRRREAFRAQLPMMNAGAAHELIIVEVTTLNQEYPLVHINETQNLTTIYEEDEPIRLEVCSFA
eukprot:m.213347 g.213347  ORF g.213347 m.213347 type:complete len:469 (+) comp15860_c1_seq1:242-1648(+)